MKQQEVNFKLNTFEGPLDLLLFLIKNKQMNISEVSLVNVANQFVDYVNQADEINLDESSEYLLLASQLLEIKTKYLINLDENKTNESENNNSADLIERLIEYDRYKKISEVFYTIYENNPKFEKEFDDFNDFVHDNVNYEYQLVSGGVIDIKRALNSVFSLIDKRKIKSTKLKVKRISVEQRRIQLENHFKNNKFSDFFDLISENTSRYMIAITLLCLLEMANSRFVEIKQSSHGEIHITSLIQKN